MLITSRSLLMVELNRRETPGFSHGGAHPVVCPRKFLSKECHYCNAAVTLPEVICRLLVVAANFD